MSIKQIYKTNTRFDIAELLNIYKSLENDSNQIMITSRGSSNLKDGVGSIFNYLPDDEWKWNQLHSIFKGTAIEDAYEYIKKDWHVGRVRFMRMHTSNRALSFHYDDSVRSVSYTHLRAHET